jgi:16S rRNA (guanine527-N7)-methyltransferase
MVSRETSGAAPDLPDAPKLPTWLESTRGGLTRYAEILVGPGIERGLLGPREAERIWDRHIVNCAVVVDPESGVVPTNSRVADIGSGAGLPGLVWAIVRADLQVVLIESLLRRATFLIECVNDLGLSNRVQVVRARAEEAAERPGSFDVVTARAVAPLAKLAQWGAPLLRTGGTLVAVKGESAAEEVTRDQQVLDQLGLTNISVRQLGQGVVDPATTVVTATRSTAE